MLHRLLSHLRSSLDVEEALEHLLSVMAKGNNCFDAFKHVCLEEARAFKSFFVDVLFVHYMCFLNVQIDSLTSFDSQNAV